MQVAHRLVFRSSLAGNAQFYALRDEPVAFLPYGCCQVELHRHVYQPRRASVSSGLSAFASSPFIGSPSPREASARTAGSL